MIPLHTRIGFFLALRALRRASLWTTSLIISVMILTFLNLVVVSGILVGLLQGAVEGVRTKFTSDIIISAPLDKRYIENSPNLITLLNSLPEIEVITPRYSMAGTLEAGYQTRKDTDKADTANANIVGIDPVLENAVTGLGEDIIAGEFLTPGDYDQVVLGHYLLSQYTPIESAGFPAPKGGRYGDKVRNGGGGFRPGVPYKGVPPAQVDEIALRAF